MYQQAVAAGQCHVSAGSSSRPVPRINRLGWAEIIFPHDGRCFSELMPPPYLVIYIYFKPLPLIHYAPSCPPATSHTLRSPTPSTPPHALYHTLHPPTRPPPTHCHYAPRAPAPHPAYFHHALPPPPTPQALRPTAAPSPHST